MTIAHARTLNTHTHTHTHIYIYIYIYNSSTKQQVYYKN